MRYMWILFILVIPFLFMWEWSIKHLSPPLELGISQETDQKSLTVEGQFPFWLNGISKQI